MSDLPDKGCYDGECNCADCMEQNAKHWNRITHAYYCYDCARRIDIDEIVDPTTPPCFSWPLSEDNDDRHSIRREQEFAHVHPDKVKND